MKRFIGPILCVIMASHAISGDMVEIKGDCSTAIGSDKCQAIVTSNKELLVTDNTAITDPIYTSIGDEYENKTVQVTPIRELRITPSHRLVGSTFSNGFFDYNFWSTATVNNGKIEVSSGSVYIYASSGTQVDGTATFLYNRVARFVSGSVNEFRAIIRISTDAPTTGTNDMRWGVASQYAYEPANDGLCFRFSNGAFYVGYIVGGVATFISTNSFNGVVPTIGPNYTRYEILYANLGASFYVNNVLVHKISALQSSLNHTVNFKIRMCNINSGGSNSRNVIESKVATILRLGAASTNPTKKYITTAGSYLLKFGPGFLHSILVNETGAVGSSIPIYDSTFTSVGDLVGILDTYKTTIAPLNYDLPFDNGLFIAPTGDFGNITIVYE